MLDDGFQHRQLHRDVDILLVSGTDMRDRLLPAGNLREPLGVLRRATVVAIPAGDSEVERYLLGPVPAGRGPEGPRWAGPVWRLRRRMDVPPVSGAVLAFCGIARPEQFFAGLESNGVGVAAGRAFPDHHRYTEADLAQLMNQARAAGAGTLLTTEKDAVRLAGLKSPLPLLTAGLHTEIEDEAAALGWLMAHLGVVVDGRASR